MKIRDLMASKGSRVVTIGPQATLQEALCTLIENKVGSLLVKGRADTLAGIITERDLMREVYQDSPLREKQVEEVMTREIVTGSPEDDIEYVMNEMTERRFRHMPVLESGRLVGIISIGDVVKAQLHLAQTRVDDLMDYVSGPLTGTG